MESDSQKNNQNLLNQRLEIHERKVQTNIAVFLLLQLTDFQ